MRREKNIKTIGKYYDRLVCVNLTSKTIIIIINTPVNSYITYAIRNSNAIATRNANYNSRESIVNWQQLTAIRTKSRNDRDCTLCQYKPTTLML